MNKRAACPGCGGPVTFKISTSKVVVCDNCGAIVARTDVAFEQIGKAAAIADSASPLRVGLKGVYNGKSFQLTGRTQLRHAAGGVWDEWYAAFSTGRWGWLAEAQGRFFLTFEQKLPKEPPPFDQLKIGEGLIRLGSSSLVIAEKGVAEILGAEGEIPYRAVSGQKHMYADLSSQGGEFGTLDYSQKPPAFFLGKEVRLQDLGINAEKLGAGREARSVAAKKVSCPHCGGALVLKAPDETQRVVCQYCNSMLDADKGELRYMKTLKEPKKPFIPIGRIGEFEGAKMTCIGYMQRSTVIQGDTWYWDEYLLYHPQIGYRWLVYSDDEWMYAWAIPPGEVQTGTNSNYVSYAGKKYTRMQVSRGRVEYVLGEFYWKVTVGETTQMEDFRGRDDSLTKEIASFDGAVEVNWTYATEISHRDVCRKFGLTYIPPVATMFPEELPDWVGTVVIVAIIVVVVLAIFYLEESGGSSGYYSGGGYRSSGGFGGGK